jgi:hypothetical protein
MKEPVRKFSEEDEEEGEGDLSLSSSSAEGTQGMAALPDWNQLVMVHDRQPTKEAIADEDEFEHLSMSMIEQELTGSMILEPRRGFAAGSRGSFFLDAHHR